MIGFSSHRVGGEPAEAESFDPLSVLGAAASGQAAGIAAVQDLSKEDFAA